MTIRGDNYPLMRPKYDVILKHATQWPGADLSSLEMLVEFARVASQFFADADSFFSVYGISRARFTVLVTLAQSPEGLTPAALAESLSVTRATMTGLMDTLERAGYAERRDDPNDRRSHTLVITPAGMSFLDEILPANMERAKAMMKTLSAGERKDLLKLLAKLEAGVQSLRASPYVRPTRRGKS